MAVTVNPPAQLPQTPPAQQANCLVRCCKAICRSIANCFRTLWDNLCCCIPCGHRQVRVQPPAVPVMPRPPIPAPVIPPLPVSTPVNDPNIRQLLTLTEDFEQRDPVARLARETLRNPDAMTEGRADEILRTRAVAEYEQDPPGNGLYAAISEGDSGQAMQRARTYLESLLDEVGSAQSSESDDDFEDAESMTSHVRDSLRGAAGYTPPVEVRRWLEMEERENDDNVGFRRGISVLSGHEARIALAFAIRESEWDRVDDLFPRSELQTLSDGNFDQVLANETDITKWILVEISQLLKDRNRLNEDLLQAQALAYLYEYDLAGTGDSLPVDVSQRRSIAGPSVSDVSLGDRESDEYSVPILPEDRYRALSWSSNVDDTRGARPREYSQADGGDTPETESVRQSIMPPENRYPALPWSINVRGAQREGFQASNDDTLEAVREPQSMLPEIHYPALPYNLNRPSFDLEENRQETASRAMGGARPREPSHAASSHIPLTGSDPQSIFQRSLHMTPLELAELATTVRRSSQSESSGARMPSIQSTVSDEDEPLGVQLARMLIDRQYEQAREFCRTHRSNNRAYRELKRLFYYQDNTQLARSVALGIIYPELGNEIRAEASMAGEGRSPFASLRQSYLDAGATPESIAGEMLLSLGLTRHLSPQTSVIQPQQTSLLAVGEGAAFHTTESTLSVSGAEDAAALSVVVPQPRECFSCFRSESDPYPDPEDPTMPPLVLVDRPLPCCTQVKGTPQYFCQTCVNKNATTRMTAEHFRDFVEHDNTIECQYCKGRFDLQLYEHYLTDRNKIKLFSYTLDAITAGVNSRLITCPDCRTNMTLDNPTVNAVICMNIDDHADKQPRELCVNCSRIWLDGHECPLSRRSVIENDIRNLRDAIDKPEKLRLCPGCPERPGRPGRPRLDCDIPIGRAGGCNEMNCTVCSANFCWICLRSWNDCINNTNPLPAHVQSYFRCRSETGEAARDRRLEDYTNRLHRLLTEYKEETGEDFKVGDADSDVTRFKPRPQQHMEDSAEVDDADDHADHLSPEEAAVQGYIDIPSSAKRIRDFLETN